MGRCTERRQPQLVRPDWPQAKLEVMLIALRAKFAAHAGPRHMLLSTAAGSMAEAPLQVCRPEQQQGWFWALQVLLFLTVLQFVMGALATCHVNIMSRTHYGSSVAYAQWLGRQERIGSVRRLLKPARTTSSGVLASTAAVPISSAGCSCGCAES